MVLNERLSKEKKKELLPDISARIPYGVIVKVSYIYEEMVYGGYVEEFSDEYDTILTGEILDEFINDGEIYNIKPYLRPMNTITPEERQEIGNLLKNKQTQLYGILNLNGCDNLLLSCAEGCKLFVDYCNKGK